MGCRRSPRVLGACAAAVLASACGGDAIGRSTPVDGTSVPTVVDGGGAPIGSDGGSADGGTKTRLTVSGLQPSLQIWDELKKVPCVPVLAADGKERCLPSNAGSVVYADSGCTHAIVSLAPDRCGAVPSYFVHNDDSSSCTRSRTTTYMAGAAIAAPGTLYNGSLGLCGPSTTPSTGPFHEAVPSDPTDWVELTPDVVPVTDSLGLGSWRGADGSVIPDGLRLLSSGVRCDRYPDTAGNAPAFCIPTLRAAQADAYADAQCSGSRIYGSHCAPTEVVDLGLRADASGKLVGGLFETGGVVSQVFVSNVFTHDVCAPFSPTADAPSYFYTVGAPLLLDRYPALSPSIQGSGRIQKEYLTSAGTNLFVESLYDSKYGEECMAMQLARGGTWCVPRTLDFGNYDAFSDSQCTARLAFGRPPATHPPWALVLDQGQCGPSTLPVPYTTVPYQGSVYTMGILEGSPACVPLVSAPPSDGTPFTLGSPLDPSQVFARVGP